MTFSKLRLTGGQRANVDRPTDDARHLDERSFRTISSGGIIFVCRHLRGSSHFRERSLVGQVACKSKPPSAPRADAKRSAASSPVFGCFQACRTPVQSCDREIRDQPLGEEKARQRHRCSSLSQRALRNKHSAQCIRSAARSCTAETPASRSRRRFDRDSIEHSVRIQYRLVTFRRTCFEPSDMVAVVIVSHRRRKYCTEAT